MSAPWSLTCGDCLGPTGMATLGDKSVAHVITDPPYSRDLYLKFRTNGGSRFGKTGRNDKQSATHLALANEEIGAADDVAEPCVQQFVRVTSRWMLIFHDAESGDLWRGPLGKLHVRCGIWLKTNPMPQLSGDRPGVGFEALEIAHQPGRKRWNSGGRSAVWTFSALQGNFPERQGNTHPCPKPVQLMEALIADFTDPGDLILDPFAGSGTTGVAAIKMGRRFIGWERNPDYYKIAVERLTAARALPTAFFDDPRQGSLLSDQAPEPTTLEATK